MTDNTFNEDRGPVIPVGMTPWHGGNAAPADWDGGPVLLRDGRMEGPETLIDDESGSQWADDNMCCDIIAYTRIPQPAPVNADDDGREAVTQDEAWSRLTRIANSFPDHNDRAGVGWVRVRWDDVGALVRLARQRVQAEAGREAEVARLRAALAPFVRHWESWMDDWEDGAPMSTFARVTFGQLRAARAALESTS